MFIITDKMDEGRPIEASYDGGRVQFVAFTTVDKAEAWLAETIRWGNAHSMTWQRDQYEITPLLVNPDMGAR